MRISASQRIGTEATALLRWWTRELRDIGQQALERAAPRLAKRLVIEFKADTAQAYALRDGLASERITVVHDPSNGWPHEFPGGELLADSHGASATLVLAPDDVLKFDLLVPESLGRDLDKVIALHLERELPLARDQFGVDYDVLEHARDTGKIRVRVLVAHRRQIDQLRELAQQWGLRPARIGALGEAGEIIGDFLRSSLRLRTLQLTSFERRLFAVACALGLALAALIAGQWTYERVVVDAQLRRIDSKAAIASHLADRFVRESAAARALLTIARVPDASDLLAALTQAVPSYAWVYQLHAHASSTGATTIHIEAFAPAATALVGVLDGARRFGTVQLISATSVGSSSDLDRLELTASRGAAHSAIFGQTR